LSSRYRILLGLQTDKTRKESLQSILHIVKTLIIQNKERILAGEKCQVTSKGKLIRITADFSTEI
jgi:hypothetical protein